MQKSEWLKQLKPGDQVIVYTGYGNERVATVDRITPAGFVVIGATTFRDGYGPRSDSRWAGRSRIEEVKADVVAKIAHRELCEYVRRVTYGNAKAMTFDELTAIKEITEAALARNPEQES